MNRGWRDSDVAFMRAALGQASQALAAGEVPVGAVIEIGGDIAGSGYNRNIVDSDPSAHAEIRALRQAARALRNHRLIDASVYVTLEPCPMCVGAMLHARVRRLVFGAYDPKAGAAGGVVDLCQHRGFNHRIEVNGGLLADESAELLKGFFAAKRG